MLIMVEKYMKDGIWHVVHRYTKAINKYMNDFNKNK